MEVPLCAVSIADGHHVPVERLELFRMFACEPDPKLVTFDVTLRPEVSEGSTGRAGDRPVFVDV